MSDETYFFGTEIEDFVLSEDQGSNAVVVGTSANFFNASNVRGYVDLYGAGDNFRYVETPQALSLTEFWIRYNNRVSTASQATRYNFLKIYAGGTERLSFLMPSTGGATVYDRIAVYKSTSSLLGTSSTFSNLTTSVLSHHIFIKIGNPGIVRIYVGTTLVYEDTALDLTWDGVTALDKLRFSNPANSASVHNCISEVGITNWDTRNSKIVLRPTNANGALDQWLRNDYTVLDELVAGAAGYLIEDDVGDRTSYSLSDFSSPGSGNVIESFKLVAHTWVDTDKIAVPFLRIGSNNYDADSVATVGRASPLDIPINFQWNRNPANEAARLTYFVLNNSEFGLKSVKSPLELVINDFVPTIMSNGEAISTIRATAYRGTPPYTYSFEGTWPTGLSIDSSTGEITGTPTANGTYSDLYVEVEDDDGDTVQEGPYEISVSDLIPFTPDLISDLWAWWDATLEAGANGSTISTMTDQSGNGRTLTTSGSPTVLENAINGLKAANFGSGNGGKKATFAATNGLTAGTRFAVVKAAANTSNQYGGLDDCGSATAVNHYTYANGVYSDWLSNARKTVGNYAVNSYHIVTGWSASSDWGYRQNGNTATQFTTTSNTVAGRATTSYLMGDSGSGWECGGELVEYMIYSRKLTNDEMELVEGYFAHKCWGAGVLNPLPSDHPYKNGAPYIPAP